MKKHMILVSLATVVLLASIPSQSQVSQSGVATDDQTAREITELLNQRQAAHLRFDREAYSSFLDPAAVYAEPGNIHSGAQQIADTHPTVGFKVLAEHDSPKVTSFGQTAIAVYAQRVKQIYGDQSLTESMMVVDSYAKKDGRWVLVAHVELPQPLKRKFVKVDPAVLSQYVGQYEWSPGFVDTISMAGGKLMAQSTGDDKPTEQQALNETTFFQDGDEGLVTFEKDASGKVSRYVYRVGDQELIAKKIK